MHNWVLPLDGVRCRCSWTNALTPGDIFSDSTGLNRSHLWALARDTFSWLHHKYPQMMQRNFVAWQQVVALHLFSALHLFKTHNTRQLYCHARIDVVVLHAAEFPNWLQQHFFTVGLKQLLRSTDRSKKCLGISQHISSSRVQHKNTCGTFEKATMMNFCASTILSSPWTGWLWRNEKVTWDLLRTMCCTTLVPRSPHIWPNFDIPWLDLRNLQVSWFEVSNEHTHTHTNCMIPCCYQLCVFIFTIGSPDHHFLIEYHQLPKQLYHLSSAWLFCSAVRSQAFLLGVLNGRHVCGIDGIVPGSRMLQFKSCQQTDSID